MTQVENVVRVLDEAGVHLKLEKCQIAKRNTEWIDYKLSAEGIKSMKEKIQAITDKLRPKNSKDLQSYMGAISQMNRFVPKLAI